MLLGHATSETVDGITRGVIVRSSELRGQQQHQQRQSDKSTRSSAQPFLRDITIEADPRAPPLNYQPAGHAAIYSPNTPQAVTRALQRLAAHGHDFGGLLFSSCSNGNDNQQQRDQPQRQQQEAVRSTSDVVIVRPNSTMMHQATMTSHAATMSKPGGAEGELTTTVDGLLRWGCDLHRTVSQTALRVMSQFAGNVDEAEQLAELARHTALYTSEVSQQYQGIVDVLERFPSVDLPLEVLLQLSTPALPRKYSITTSPSSCCFPCPRS